MLIDLNIPGYEPSANVLALVAGESRFIKDLKINVGNVLNNSQHLNRKEAVLLALAVAVNERFPLLQESFTGMAREAGATTGACCFAASPPARRPDGGAG